MQVVVARRKVLGEDHPETLTSISNLALAYTHQGKYKEAVKVCSVALEEREKKLGPDHFDTLLSLISLRCLIQLEEPGCHQEATDLYQRACSAFESRLGASHPTAIACREHFTSMLSATVRGTDLNGLAIAPQRKKRRQR